MAEELKHLIEQIQREGVEKAEQQADTIVSQAREKAARIVDEAEKKAADTLRQAKSEAEAFAQRSTRTLEQAARDLVITLGQACARVVTETLERQIAETIKGDLLEQMILKVLEQNGGSAVELGVSAKDQEALTAFCAEQARKSGREIDLVVDSEILAGFKIAFRDQHAYLDVGSTAIADALGAFLRPELAKTVGAIAREELNKA